MVRISIGRDVRLAVASELEERASGRCEVCAEPVPGGRARCLAHSAYGQALLRAIAADAVRERRIDVRRTRQVA